MKITIEMPWASFDEFLLWFDALPKDAKQVLIYFACSAVVTAVFLILQSFAQEPLGCWAYLVAVAWSPFLGPLVALVAIGEAAQDTARRWRRWRARRRPHGTNVIT